MGRKVPPKRKKLVVDVVGAVDKRRKGTAVVKGAGGVGLGEWG
jgi:hypothetical protein